MVKQEVPMDASAAQAPEQNEFERRVSLIVPILNMQIENNNVQHHKEWALTSLQARPDVRMAIQELVEVWDHLPDGQWWKGGKSADVFRDRHALYQGAVEIVDALHFAFSHLIRQFVRGVGTAYFEPNPQQAQVAMLQDLAGRIAGASLDAHNRTQQTLNEVQQRIPMGEGEAAAEEAAVVMELRSVELMHHFNAAIDTCILNANFNIDLAKASVSTVDGYGCLWDDQSLIRFFSHAFRALYLIQVPFDAFVLMYTAKNRLNTFRVLNGYTKADGRYCYQKTAYDFWTHPLYSEAADHYDAQGDSWPLEWKRKEDNFYLESIIESIQAQGGSSDFNQMIAQLDAQFTDMYRQRLIEVMSRTNVYDNNEPCRNVVDGWALALDDQYGLVYRKLDIDSEGVVKGVSDVMIYKGYHPAFIPTTQPEQAPAPQPARAGDTVH